MQKRVQSHSSMDFVSLPSGERCGADHARRNAFGITSTAAVVMTPWPLPHAFAEDGSMTNASSDKKEAKRGRDGFMVVRGCGGM
jgi:hypothetical protein